MVEEGEVDKWGRREGTGVRDEGRDTHLNGLSPQP